MVIEGLDELSKTIETNVKQYKKAVESVMPTINNAFESFQSSIKELDRIITPLIEHLKYNILVPTQVYDFLVKMRAPLSIDEIKELQRLETKEDRKLFRVYTRKTKGRKIYNPQFYVNKELFDAILTLVRRNGSSLAVKNNIVYFDFKTCALDVYGLVTYIKKDSERYRLCKYFFGKKRGSREWEVVDIVNALSDGERQFDITRKKESYDWINGKVTELNKDVKNSLGADELVSYEGGRFILNSANRL